MIPDTIFLQEKKKQKMKDKHCSRSWEMIEQQISQFVVIFNKSSYGHWNSDIASDKTEPPGELATSNY